MRSEPTTKASRNDGKERAACATEAEHVLEVIYVSIVGRLLFVGYDTSNGARHVKLEPRIALPRWWSDAWRQRSQYHCSA